VVEVLTGRKKIESSWPRGQGERKGGKVSIEHSTTDLDALVREEKRLTAAECHAEAWAEGLSAGIEGDIIAETAMSTALCEFLRLSGESATLALIDRMRDRVLAGEFEPVQVRH